jgi:4-amino-4-deoxy-L-arabinose transferase-like glycosyltransferase
VTSRRIALVILIAVVVITLAARVFGPGDLYDKDQPKTMAGSADVALNGNWIWPRDMLREPATKPPMYNWLDAIVLKLAPRWDEWTFKLPSVAATILVAWLIVVMTRRLLREHDQRDLVAFVAAAVWVANVPVMKQMYLSRPDMVMTAFLTGAWVCATRAMSAERSTGRMALGFWLCLAGAALSKGPAAMLPLVYVLVAMLLQRQWKPARRLHVAWGAPLLLILVGGWALLAYLHWPDAFWGVLKSEGTSRLTTGGPESISKPLWMTPMWFVSKFLPWSLAVLLALLLIGPRRWLRHELAPAIVWVAIAVVAFSIPPGKRPDYLLPAYPAAAILAAYGMVEVARRVRVPAPAPVAVVALAPLLMAVYLAHWELRRSPEVKSGYTRSLVAFTDDVRRIVPRDAKVVSLVKGYQPILSLLGRYDGNRAQADDFTPGTWVIAPRQPDWPAYATSRTLPDVIELGPKQIVPGEVALYRVGDDGVTREALLVMLARQYAWNFPPDRYRASRDVSSGTTGGAGGAAGGAGGSGGGR